MHIIYQYSSTQTRFYEFLVVMCSISLNMHVLESLLKFEIFIIKIPEDLLFIFLVLNAVFITVYQTTAVQDISWKTVPIWLHDTVGWIWLSEYYSGLIRLASSRLTKSAANFFGTKSWKIIFFPFLKVYSSEFHWSFFLRKEKTVEAKFYFSFVFLWKLG